MSKLTGSRKATQFTESVIREMTRLNDLHGGVNLSQGFPDFPAPQAIKAAACEAINGDVNQYAVTWGARPLREAVAREFTRRYGLPVVADAQVTVCCGSTEAMMSTMMAIIDPGDEVIIFEPFYENYGPDVILAGATPRYVALRDPDFSIDRAELEAAFSPRTKAIVINTPHNPSGKVFTRPELEAIAALCQRHDTLAITDEIYEHIIYGGARHVSIASLAGMAARTVTISGLSKTYSITGWRLAYAIASEEITAAIRKVHDFLTVGAPHPLQEAGAVALRMPESFYAELTAMYERKRGALYAALTEAGLECSNPDGAYYIVAEIGKLGFKDDFAAADFILDEVGVAAVPGSSFYHRAELGHRKIRFTFSKSDETIAAAAERLGHLQERVSRRQRQ